MSEGTSTPLVTVVTASFNALDGLRATVASVAAQVGVAVEHIVVDGGSSDGTRSYLEELGDAVRWVSEPDEGIGDALNKGIAMAQGEYVLVLQAEDRFLTENSLLQAAARMAEGPDILAYRVLMELQGGGTRLRSTRPLGWLTEFKMTNPHQGMLCRRDLFERIGLFDTSFTIAMDYEWLLRAKRAGARLVAVPETLAVMPATGVSTRLDWPAMARRLDEDRRLHRRHSRGGMGRAINAAFWTVYRPFKQIKARVQGG